MQVLVGRHRPSENKQIVFCSLANKRQDNQAAALTLLKQDIVL
jgi:hypothetical protein